LSLKSIDGWRIKELIASHRPQIKFSNCHRWTMDQVKRPCTYYTSTVKLRRFNKKKQRWTK